VEFVEIMQIYRKIFN